MPERVRALHITGQGEFFFRRVGVDHLLLVAVLVNLGEAQAAAPVLLGAEERHFLTAKMRIRMCSADLPALGLKPNLPA